MKKTTLLLLVICSSLFINIANAQITDIVVFAGGSTPEGDDPYGNVIRVGNKLYGMTIYGGTSFSGNIFSVDTNGNNFQNLWDFDGGGDTNGSDPKGSLIYFKGTLYGMTQLGGLHYDGNVFRIDTNGTKYKDLYDFNGSDGKQPQGYLTLSGAKLFGMTEFGGTNLDGNIFSVDTDGSNYKNLWNFNGGGDTNGSQPGGSLILVGKKLYGMTTSGGTKSDGNIFSIDTNGSKYKDLWNFNGGGDTNGSFPDAGTLTYSAGLLYGMTSLGGVDTNGNIFRIDTNGSGYKNLWSCTGGASGDQPYGSLILSATNDTLFGMTPLGGTYSAGNIFSIAINGSSYKDLAEFNGTNGLYPDGDLLLSGHVLYGMAFNGGTGSGVVFGLKGNLTDIGPIDNGKQASINVYPNPSSGAFTLQVESEKVKVESATVEIYSMLAEKIYSNYQITKSSNYQIDLSSQPSGVYLYRVIANTGDLIGEGKLVIQK